MSNHRTDGTLWRICNTRVLIYFIFMVAQGCFCHRTHITFLAVGHGGVVGRKDGRNRSDDRTQSLVQGLAFRLTDDFLEGRAGFGIIGIGRGGNARMLCKVVVMVGGGVRDGADEPRSIHVEVWMRGREDRVGGSNYRADQLFCSHGIRI